MSNTSVIEIFKIKENEFNFKSDGLSIIDKNLLSIGFKFQFDWNLELEHFTSKLNIKYSYKAESKPIDLVLFSFEITFFVEDLKNIIKIKTHNFALPDAIMETLVDSTIASARGILFNKLSSTVLSNYYLPLIHPKDVINEINVNKLSPKKVVRKKTEKDKKISN